MKPLILYFYTPGYKKYADKLASSLEALDLDHHPVEINDQRKWLKNAHQKAPLILEVMGDFNRDIVYLDVDSIVHEMPEEILSPSADIALSMLEGKVPMISAIYFRNCPAVRAFLKDWAQENRRFPNLYDRTTFDVVRKDHPHLKIKTLGPGYWMSPHLKRPDHVIIEHRMVGPDPRSEGVA
jgi:hypothetical protein